jgi:hypothetical protein
VLAGDCGRPEAAFPIRFVRTWHWHRGQPHFSMVFDVLGQRVLNSPRLSVYTLHATGAAGSADLPDIRFAPIRLGHRRIAGLQITSPRLLVNFKYALQPGRQGVSRPRCAFDWN